MCQVAEEEGNANQCVASIVAGGIDDTAVAFATDDSTHFLHLGRHIDFTHGRSIIGLSITCRHITQGTGRTQVGNGRAWRVLQYIVGHADQRIFLAIHPSVLADDSQTIHVGVYHKGHIVAALGHQPHDVTQVALQRLGVVLEVACGFAIELLHMLHAQLLQQLGQNDAAH